MGDIKIQNGSFTLHVECDDFSPPWIRNKTPILMQHGFGRTASVWTTWIPTLSEHYPLLRPNLRGLRSKPASFTSDDLNLDAYMSDLRAILDDQRIDRVHFCGESFGGCLGLAFAARFPERVASLSVIASPVFKNPKWHENYSMGYGSWSKAMRAMGVSAWLDATNKSTRFPQSISPDFVAWYKSLVEGSDEDVIVAMAEFVETTDLRPLLPQIKAPTLLLTPAGGSIMTNEQLEAYRAGVKNLTVLKFETEFHKIHLLRAHQCAAHVMHFCSFADGRALIDF